MAKPIAVLYVPNADHFGPDVNCGELMAALNGGHHKIEMPSRFCDYLWFVFVNGELVAPELKVFHEKDYTKEQYAELYKLLEEGINSLKNKE